MLGLRGPILAAEASMQKNFPTKVSVPIKVFWYSDRIVWPKTVTIITTVNKEGVPNAAPLSGIMHYDNLDKQPRVMLHMRKFAHTIQNICDTGPGFIRPMVIEMAEQVVTDEGDDVVTDARFQRLIDKYTPPELMDRIDTSE